MRMDMIARSLEDWKRGQAYKTFLFWDVLIIHCHRCSCCCHAWFQCILPKYCFEEGEGTVTTISGWLRLHHPYQIPRLSLFSSGHEARFHDQVSLQFCEASWSSLGSGWWGGKLECPKICFLKLPDPPILFLSCLLTFRMWTSVGGRVQDGRSQGP